MKLTPCPSCGAPRRARSHGCARCGWRSAASTKPTRPDLRTAVHRRRSAELLAEWRAQHGDLCPGWPPTDHAPHPCSDLTAHHVTEDKDGPLVVLCRSENSSIGAPA